MSCAKLVENLATRAKNCMDYSPFCAKQVSWKLKILDFLIFYSKMYQEDFCADTDCLLMIKQNYIISIQNNVECFIRKFTVHIIAK